MCVQLCFQKFDVELMQHVLVNSLFFFTANNFYFLHTQTVIQAALQSSCRPAVAPKPTETPLPVFPTLVRIVVNLNVPSLEAPNSQKTRYVEGDVQNVQRHLLLPCDAVALWPDAAGVTEVST